MLERLLGGCLLVQKKKLKIKIKIKMTVLAVLDILDFIEL